MAQTVQQVEHYSLSIADKTGEGARILGTFRDAGVNFIAVWGYPRGTGRAQLELIPENGRALVAAAKRAKLMLSKSTAFYIHDNDRPGAVADTLKKLADAEISVRALQAVCGGSGTYGAVVFLPSRATKKAASILGAH
jgi:hypothetical protein